MFYIDNILIKEELGRGIEAGFSFHYEKLSNRFLDWLFRHYECMELCENFYDSEPHFEDEEYNMYLDYKKGSQMLTGKSIFCLMTAMDEEGKIDENHSFCKEEHTIEELAQAYQRVKQAYQDYEMERISKCSWQEPYFKGNYGYSQKFVDDFAREMLMKTKRFPRTIKDRLFIARKGDEIRIYFYGRDYWEVDYWFIFKRK